MASKGQVTFLYLFLVNFYAERSQLLREVIDELFERTTMVMRLKAQLLAAILFKLKAFHRQGLSSFSLSHVSCLPHRRLLVNIFGERHAYAGVFIQKSWFQMLLRHLQMLIKVINWTDGHAPVPTKKWIRTRNHNLEWWGLNRMN